tara:strand:- start:196 stop:1002 length:807 start_codon:yes stop_codon:yes gene_type:complete
MKVTCRGKEFDQYSPKEAKKRGITPVDNWRDAEIGDWILTADKKVIQCTGKKTKKFANTKKPYIFIRTGYGERGCHKKHYYAQKQHDWDLDNRYVGDLIKDVRPTAKQKTFVDFLFLHGITNKLGMWDTESVVLAYQSVYKDNNPEQALRRGLTILKRKHIREYISMNMREKLSALGMDDDYVADKYRDLIEGDTPAATKLNALNRVSDMLGHLTKEKKEEQIEGVFALSDGDIKKLSSVRKTIAETTYGAKQDSKDNGVHKSASVSK